MLLRRDGKKIGAYVARPAVPNGEGVVVLHEAFGVTPFITATCDWLARQGYVAVAPDMLSHAGAQTGNNVLPQNGAGLEEGRQRILATPLELTLGDVAAARDAVAHHAGRVHVVGFCWGGSMAYAGATRLAGFSTCSPFYGGKLAELTALGQPSCPTQVHLATLDRYIPLDATRTAFAANHPAAEVFVYDADHGFCRHDGVTYDAVAKDLAFGRWLRLMQSKV